MYDQKSSKTTARDSASALAIALQYSRSSGSLAFWSDAVSLPGLKMPQFGFYEPLQLYAWGFDGVGCRDRSRESSFFFFTTMPKDSPEDRQRLVCYPA